MSLNDICNDLLKQVNEAVGVAVVDVSSGLMLAVAHNVPYFTQSYLDAVAAAAVDMFRGKTISNVEKLLSATRGKEAKNLIQEVQMTTEGTYHFMSIVPGKPQCLAVLITTRRANLGMGWASLRKALTDIAPLCP
jgi:predicted regulator of Ras-like GTPase activity (Roadblock/LC7/MglB family)